MLAPMVLPRSRTTPNIFSMACLNAGSVSKALRASAAAVALATMVSMAAPDTAAETEEPVMAAVTTGVMTPSMIEFMTMVSAWP
ncbi:hypothetical protein D3C72_2143360 [compost metagenome]